ncbi:hypothetical protein ACXR2T_05885 [Leucobacter sp. HY1910]
MIWFLQEATSESGSSGSALPVIAAVVSFLTAVIMVAGPPLIKKLFPSDQTLNEIARESVTTTKTALDSVHSLLDKSLISIEKTTASMNEKLDEVRHNTRK